MQSRTVRRPEQADAAVLALPDGSALAVSIDCNGRRVAADPYTGTVEAVLECAANLACVGAEPLGTTNNLNFGNPEKPHIAWQLSESVRGLGDACRALRAPIVGGNVSLYNEGATGPIYPTPVIGMVGRLPDARRAGRLGFARPGDEIALVGPLRPSLPASELAKLLGGPLPDGLARGRHRRRPRRAAAVRDAVRAGALSSAHDIAEGGLAVALAECCLGGGLGAQVELAKDLWEAAPRSPRRRRARASPRRRVPAAAATRGTGHRAVRRGPGRLHRQRRGRCACARWASACRSSRSAGSATTCSASSRRARPRARCSRSRSTSSPTRTRASL